jgi:hypothetical protein
MTPILCALTLRLMPAVPGESVLSLLLTLAWLSTLRPRSATPTTSPAAFPTSIPGGTVRSTIHI